MQEFFHMGGHGVYIWPAYAITMVVLLANVIVSNIQLKNRIRKVGQLRRSVNKRNPEKDNDAS